MRFARVPLALLALAACGRTLTYRDLDPDASTEKPKPDAGATRLPDGGHPPDAGPCFESRTPFIAWQAHRSETIVCFGMQFDRNGHMSEYDFASIPAENAPGWVLHPAPAIDFSTRSRLCGSADGGPPVCPCRGGADFTYFQTSFDLLAPAKSFVFSARDVDDGFRATLFNDKHPEGFVGGFGFLFNPITIDFKDETAAGHNRLVLTHVDDCCSERRLTGGSLTLDGEELVPCP